MRQGAVRSWPGKLQPGDRCDSSVDSSSRAHCEEIGEDIGEVLRRKGFLVVDGHEGFAGLLERFQAAFFEELDLLLGVHHLQAEIVFVEGDAGELPVVSADGRQFTGATLNEDNFSLQMMDTQQQVQLFEKGTLKSFQKSRESLMPVYDEK